MAKKKATMTLKDFHGGSIPSDLPLPSAPGVIVRPSDRVGFDRSNVWGNSIGRSDYRLRPGSAGSVRAFDDKTPFLTHVNHIGGRNFDEDERTPLDGVSGPRRTVSDDSIRVPVGVESRVDCVVERNRPVSSVARLSGESRMGYQSRPGGNPWAVRKEAVGKDQGMSCWPGQDAATKLAHASALEKVSSGRWHSKQLSEGNRVDIEVISHPEPHIETHFKGYGMLDRHVRGNVDVLDRSDSHEAILVRQMEKSLIVDDGIYDGGRALPVHERAVPTMYSDVQENQIYDDGHQPSPVVGNYVRSELQPTLHPESSERPKLNLLPRSTPSETVEPPPTNHKQSFQKPRDPGHHSHVSEAYERVSTFKSDPESGRGVPDRPKLNLKPRMQPLDHLERNIDAKRNTLFGGARPREMVLKERGINDVDIYNNNQIHPSNRVKQDFPRGEILPMRYNGKAENYPLDHRIGKNIDRHDHRGDVDKSDMQRKNWRSENRRSRDLEKNQPPPERAPSPETWRKPVEQPPSPTGLRYGKAASAVELAQAFSKSVSSGQRGLPGRGQIPFSRLTGPLVLSQGLR